MPLPGDDVDRIVAAWKKERPDLDVSPLHVLSRVGRIAKHLDRLRRDAFNTHDLEVWEFDVLAALRRSGPPYALSPTTLMSETLVTSGAMTNRINRLEARGFVTRDPDDSDGRKVLVQLTRQGEITVDLAFDALLKLERHLLRSVAAADRAVLRDLLRTLSSDIEGP